MSTHKGIPIASPIVRMERTEVNERLQAIQRQQHVLLDKMREVRATQVQIAKDQQHLVDEWNQLLLQREGVQTGLPTASPHNDLLLLPPEEQAEELSKRTADEDTILLNCLEWEHKYLVAAMGVKSGVDQYSTLSIRQQQVTGHIQAALLGIEDLQAEVRAETALPTPVRE